MKRNPMVDFYWRVEFQLKGSPHLHMLIWIQFPHRYIRGMSWNDVEYQSCIQLINEFITCELPISCLNGVEQQYIEADTVNMTAVQKQTYKKAIEQDNAEYKKLQKLCFYQRHQHMANCLIAIPNNRDLNVSYLSDLNASMQYESQEDANIHTLDGEDAMDLDDDQQSPPSPTNNTNDDDEYDPNESFVVRPIVKNKCCKYGFPKPILDRTWILEPLPFDKKIKYKPGEDEAQSKLDHNIKVRAQRNELRKARENYQKIRMHLEAMAYAQAKWYKNVYKKDKTAKITYQTCTYEEWLDLLGMNESEYLKAIRSSITKTTAFLRRTCHEIMINNYNKLIILCHEGNMDIQFINDSEGLVVYVCAYLMKANAKMSVLLEMVEREIRHNNNMNLMRKMQTIGNKLQNCQEIGAQEVVYLLCALPLSVCSREQRFILTFRKQEMSMIKDKRILRGFYFSLFF
jgi:hypothetical protein